MTAEELDDLMRNLPPPPAGMTFDVAITIAVVATFQLYKHWGDMLAIMGRESSPASPPGAPRP